MLITNEESKGMLPIIVTSYLTSNHGILSHQAPPVSLHEGGSIGTYGLDEGTVTTETANRTGETYVLRR